MRVLIAEDDPTSALILEGVLTELGYQVEVAYDGRDAWEKVRGNDFRIVISDWEMPHLSGIELCRRIRQREGGRVRLYHSADLQERLAQFDRGPRGRRRRFRHQAVQRG